MSGNDWCTSAERVPRLGERRTAARAESVSLPWENAGLLLGNGSEQQAGRGGAAASPRVRRYLGGGFETSLAFLRPSIDSREDLERPYEENVWVRAAIKAFAEAFCQLPGEVWTRPVNEEGAAKVTGHPLVQLLNSPNPIQTTAEFWTAHVTNYKLDGETYWFLADVDGRPIDTSGDAGRTQFISKLPDQIIPVRGKLVEHATNERGVPVMYRFQMAGVSSSADGNWSEPFPAGAVVAFTDYDPESIIRGLGDTQSVQRETELYFQAQRYLDASVRNGGNPGAWIVYEQRLAADERARREAEAEDQYTNESVGQLRVLDGNAKIIPNPIGPKDMEYRTLLEWLRDSILAAMGVPPPMVGVYDDATYNNIETARSILWTGPNGVLSLVRRTEDAVTNKLLRRLRPGGTDVWRFNTDAVDVLQEDRAPQIQLAKEIVAAGIGVGMRRAFELQGIGYPFDDDDEALDPGFVSTTLRPASQVIVEESDETTASETATLNGAQIAQLASIVQAVGDGSVPKASAIEIVLTSFPIDRSRANAIFASVVEGANKPEPVVVAPPPPTINQGREPRPRPGAQGDDDDETPVGARRAERDPEAPVEADPRLAKELEGWLNSYVREVQRRIRAEVRANDDGVTMEMLDSLVPYLAEWEERLTRATQPHVERILEDELAAAREMMGGAFIEMEDPRVLALLAEQRLRLSGVAQTTERKIRRAMFNVLKGGGGTGELQDVLVDRLPPLSKRLERIFGTNEARALAISRTEVGRAKNTARVLQARDQGVKRMRWSTARDGEVRDSHRALQGEERDVGEPFSNGLRYPHDPNGPAGEVVNCRCTVVPVVRKAPPS